LSGLFVFRTALWRSTSPHGRLSRQSFRWRRHPQILALWNVHQKLRCACLRHTERLGKRRRCFLRIEGLQPRQENRIFGLAPKPTWNALRGPARRSVVDLDDGLVLPGRLVASHYQSGALIFLNARLSIAPYAGGSNGTRRGMDTCHSWWHDGRDLWWNHPGRTLTSTKGRLFRLVIAAPREAP